MVSGQLLQYLLSGVTTGSVYAIIGIGFNIIYNSTGIINFAQGEFLMLGGMISITLSHSLPLAAAIPLEPTGPFILFLEILVTVPHFLIILCPQVASQ